MDIDINLLTDFPTLSYEEEQEKELCLRKATETTINTRSQGGTNKVSSCQIFHGDYMPNNRTKSQTYGNNDDNVINIQLLYNPNTPMEPDLWSGNFHPISLHRSISQIASDTKNIKDSLNFMAKYITNKKVNPKLANKLVDLDGIGDAVWNFISSVYQSSWDFLYTDNKSKTLREKISAKFTPIIAPSPNSKNNKLVSKMVPASIDKVPPPPLLPAKSAKEVNTISKYFQNQKLLNDKSKDRPKPSKSYAQASKNNVSTAEVLKIKKTFPTLNAAKINQINNIVNGTFKPKPRIQMTTKGLSRKQVIIPMSKDNVDIFIKNSSLHISNINRQFQNAKSEILVDYIRAKSLGITVVTNKVAQSSDLMLIDQYVKNSSDVNALQVEEPRLPKSKLYLNIIGILYYPHTNSQEHLTSGDIKLILKQNQIFDNVSLASKPQVIKVSPKSDMSIIWINIWDVQSRTNTKMLINRCFNVGKYITTIQGANMNPGVPQCKNCWKWGHATFSCRIQGSKCVKCNGPHKLENHRDFGWCCKANDKINPPRLKTKKGDSCPHTFKCSNCYGNHQADLNACSF